MVYFSHLASHCSAHDKPHEQLDTLRTGIAHGVACGVSSQRLGIADDLLQTHEIELLIDESGSCAVKLVRQTTRPNNQYSDVFLVGLDSPSNRLPQFVAARRTRQRKLNGVHRDWNGCHRTPTRLRP